MVDRELLGTEVAIVGMAGRFPGAADIDEFWHNLRSGTNSIRSVSDAELDALGVDARLREHPGFVPSVAMLADPDRFDAEFFGVQPRDAELMDPQQRVFLECCWHALENAGRAADRPGGVVSVFGATSLSSYLLFNLAPAQRGPGTVLDGLQLGSLNAPDFLASRVAYKLGFDGPAVSVSTACSSSLVAVHLAAQSLLSRECDVALAGGVSVQTHHRGGYVHTPQDITSADGTVRPFDAGATGTVFGSGAGVVVLRRLEDALADGDPIRAVLLATAVNNDGDRKVGFTAPGVDGQAEVIAQALANAELDAADIGYVEAHGTATQLGDSVEVRALRKVFGPRPAPPVLGSVKGNIGHLDAAAGIAGLIKTVLALQHGELPSTVHFQRPAEHLELADGRFLVSGELRPWTAPAGAPRRAGVSSFGVGGTNAHAILEEAPPRQPRRAGEAGWQAVVVSARTAAALEESAARLSAHLLDNPDLDLADLAFTTQEGRVALPYRRAVIARTTEDAARALADPDAAEAGVAPATSPGVAFVFPGMGSYHHGMAARLHRGDGALSAAFRAEFGPCAALVSARIGRDLTSLLDADEADDWPDRPELAMPALFAVEYALGRALIGVGVRPSVLLGHSLGEYTAACLAGVLSVEDAVDIVCTRAELVAELPSGAMLSVALPEQRVRELLDERLSLAAVNGPRSCVVSGRAEDVAAFARRLTEEDIRTTPLRVGVGFHSHLVEPVLDRFEAAVRRATLRPPTLPLISGLTGKVAAEQVTDPRYWVDHLRQPVRFADVVRAAEDAVLVEVGPGQTLQPLLRMNADQDATVLAVLDRAGGAADAERFTAAIGRLWAVGVPVDWAAVRGDTPARRVALPGYPFARTSFWVDPPRTVPAAAVGPAAVARPAAIPAAAPARADQVAGRIAAILGRVSGLPADELDVDANLFELGFDSLALVQAGDAIRQAFDVSVPLRRLFEELASIRALAAYIADQLPASEPGPPAEEPVAVVPGDPVSTVIAEQLALLRRNNELQHELFERQLALLRGESSAQIATTPVAKADKAPARFSPQGAVDTSAGNLTERQRRHVTELAARYNAKTAESKRRTAQSRHVRANHRNCLNFRSEFKELIYPIQVAKGSGARFVDIDGNEYVDLAMGFGASLFGHEPEFVTDAVRAELDNGSGLLIGPVSPHAGDVARLIVELTGVERVAFYNTGTQAVMLAIRLARAATGRSKVVMFNGAFHGIYDATLVRPDFLGDETACLPAVPGITARSVGDTLLLEYDKPASLDAIRRHADELAAVLVEPVQSRNPAGQSPEFLRALRAVTEEYGIALVLDETITGFRLHAGGAQALFGVQADIVTYGKVVGGGLPIGVVAGKAAYLDCVDGGDWSYGDDSTPPNDERRTFLGGTFCEFPLSMVAARAALEHVRAQGPALQESVNRKMADLVARLDTLFAEQDVPITTSHFASMLRLVVPRDLELIFYHLLDQGVYTWEGRTLFLSTAHTDADLDRIVDAFRAAIAQLRSGGFLPDQPRPPVELPLTAEQRQLWFAAGVGGSTALAYVDAVLVGLDGALRPDWLSAALREVVRRHDALRTAFDVDGEHQSVRRAVDVTLPLLDWTDGSDDDEFEARLRDWTVAHMRTEFDLGTPPLLRAWLVRRAPDRHELVLVGHHLALDGWSWGVLVDDLARHYAVRAGAARQPGPAPRFEEFLRWQAELLSGQDGAAARDYWRTQLADPPAPLRLPTGAAATPGRCSAEVPAELRDRLAAVARSAHSSMATVLCTAFELLLCRLTGRREFMFGLPSAGQLAMGGVALIGNCSSVLPIRASLTSDTIAEVLASVHRTLAGGYEHQGVSLAALATDDAELRPPVLTALFNVDQPIDVHLPGITVNARPGPVAAARAVLFANITIEPSALRVDFDFDDSVGESDRRRWLAVYTELLALLADGAHQTVEGLLAEVEHRTGVGTAGPEPVTDLLAAPSATMPEHVPARTDAERRVARVWAEVFDAAEPGVHDNFFELGGTSFIATRLVAGLREEFGTRLALRSVFDAPTVAELAAVLSGEAVPDTEGPTGAIGLDTRDGGVYPLSLAQRRLWYVEQLDPGSSYTVFVAVRMEGDLDVDVLALCVREIVRRQASLRTRFTEVRGEPMQVIDPDDTTPLSIVEVGAGDVDRCVQEELNRPFDLGAGRLLRTTLLRLDPREHVLLVAMHHIVSDGWSLDVLLHELTARYAAHTAGVEPDLPDLPIQYPDFARWQRDWLEGEEFQGQLAYWRGRLAGLGPLELPTDRPRPPTPGFAGATHKFALPRSVADEVRRFSQAERASVFITMLAAFQALLYSVSGQDDIAVGTPSAGRWVPHTEELIGFFLNMLVIRTDLGGRPTFRELVGQVRDLVLAADANQGVPFDLLVDDLGVTRDPSRSPLFNVMFLLDSTHAHWSTAGLEMSRVPFDWHTAKFDLSLLIDDVDGELTCVLEYRTDLFDWETIELFAERFETFTGKAIANPAVRL